MSNKFHRRDDPHSFRTSFGLLLWFPLLVLTACAGSDEAYQAGEIARTLEFQWQREGYLPPGESFDDATNRCIDDAGSDITSEDLGASGFETASSEVRVFIARVNDECTSDAELERFFRIDMVTGAGMTEVEAACLAPRFVELVRTLDYSSVFVDRTDAAADSINEHRAFCGVS